MAVVNHRCVGRPRRRVLRRRDLGPPVLPGRSDGPCCTSAPAAACQKDFVGASPPAAGDSVRVSTSRRATSRSCHHAGERADPPNPRSSPAPPQPLCPCIRRAWPAGRCHHDLGQRRLPLLTEPRGRCCRQLCRRGRIPALAAFAGVPLPAGLQHPQAADLGSSPQQSVGSAASRPLGPSSAPATSGRGWRYP